jgi:hypothetical protein
MAEKPWADLTPDEKMDRRFANWLDPGCSFANEKAKKAYRDRVTRLTAAMRLKGTPDRVPIPLATAEGYPAHRVGLTPYDGMHDFAPTAKAFADFNLTFQPDAMVSPAFATLPASAFEIIDYHLFILPGNGIPKESNFQYNEQEWMFAEDYDALISDPSDFLLRTYLPRIASGLKGFSKLGTALDPAVLISATGFLGSWADVEVQAALERALSAGKEVQAWSAKLQQVMDRIQGEGFPPFFPGATFAPFDYLGDSLRGTKSIMTDLYRYPEKVLAACERLVPLMVRWVTEKATSETFPGVFIPLHKGADGFMSDEQFRTFYWPSLLRVIHGLNDEGFMPVLFAEGAYASRLGVLAAELPSSKSVWYFDRTDMALAKKTIGKVACIQGNVPLSLLHAGSPGEVTDYCRGLIEAAAPGGGFLLDIGAVMHQGNDENLWAMMRSVLDYGVY